ncbi:pseudaminic acid cytidylyltransferase [Shewanella maritima]|uniref:pseudaminic acid cytidylyltransferase n=1 Tax=Shewanella maritima TaxID=2520507 RepID=UPI0037364545
MNIAIIPARGGSKRIPKKNIKDFAGKPLIAYSIDAAVNSGCFDKVIVSTDDSEIAEVARSYGAETPFIRPDNIADDYATTAVVIAHAIDWCQQQNYSIDFVCCVYATAPFIQIEHIRDSLALIKQHGSASYCFPVCEFSFPIQRAISIDEHSRVSMFQPEHFNTRSQDLTQGFHDVGQFYWGKPHAFVQQIPMFSEAAIAYPISRKWVIDLDTQEDWEYALLLQKALKG